MKKLMMPLVAIFFATTMFNANSLAQTVNLSKGLVAHYPLDGGAYDVLEKRGYNNMSATVNGASLTTDRNGKSNCAYCFDGNDDYIKISNNSKLNFGYSSFSFSVWLKYGSQAGGSSNYSAIILKSKLNNPWEGMTLFVDQPNPGKLEFRMTASGNNKLHNEFLRLNDNKWFHLVCIRDNNILKVFKNGVQIGAKKVAPTNISNNQPLWLGCNQKNTRHQNYKGCMDDLRFYNRALNPAEINTLYGGSAKTYPKIRVVPNQFKDKRDGHVYKTVKIGNQVWMAKNLAYKTNSGSWAYDNNEKNVGRYGRLYNWGAAQNVCPSGWRLPTKLEFEILLNNISNKYPTLFKGKAAYKALIPGGSSGFSSSFGGWTSNSKFHYIGKLEGFWSLSQKDSYNAWCLHVESIDLNANVAYEDKYVGFSVRCIKDN